MSQASLSGATSDGPLRSYDGSPAGERVAILQIGSAVLAIPAKVASEVVVPRRIARIPGAPGSVLGLVNVRGRLVTVIDLAASMGLEHTGIGPESRILVLEHRGSHAGLLVPGVAGIVEAVLEVGGGSDSERLFLGRFSADGWEGDLIDVDRLLERIFGS